MQGLVPLETIQTLAYDQQYDQGYGRQHRVVQIHRMVLLPALSLVYSAEDGLAESLQE
jgi:hypothetical protein